MCSVQRTGTYDFSLIHFLDLFPTYAAKLAEYKRPLNSHCIYVESAAATGELRLSEVLQHNIHCSFKIL